MHRTALVLLLVLGAALAPASAEAAPSWLAPTQVSAPQAPEGSRFPEVVMDARGDSAAVFVSAEKTGGIDARVEAAVRPAGGSWGEPVPLSPSGVETDGAEVAIDEAGEVTVVWSQEVEAGADVLRSATSQLGSGWTPPVDVSAAGDAPGYFELAADPAGEAIVAYSDSDGMHSRARVTSRKAGGAWSPPATVSSEGEEVGAPSIAIGDDGDAVVVWSLLATGIRAVERPAGGAWSEPVYIATATESFYAPSVAVAPDGEAVAVWRNAINGVGAVVESAAEAGGAWSPPVELGGGFFYSEAPRVAIDASGEAVALWERSESSDLSVVAAARPRGGAWSVPTELPRPDGEQTYQPGLAISAGGQAVAIWISGEGIKRVIRASVRAVGAAWSAPTELSKPGERAESPNVAADARGDAVAAWEGGTSTTPQVEAVGFDGAGPELRLLSIPGSGVVGAPIAFSVDAVDVWSGVSSISWNFGDGGTAGGAKVAHTYPKFGRYPVGIFAVDALGNSTTASGTVSTVAKGVARGGRTAIVRRGRAALTLRCPAVQCAGLAELLAKPRPSHGKKAAKKRRRLTVAGKSPFSIAPAAHVVLKVKLRAPVLKRLKQLPRHQLKVRLEGEGVVAGAVILRLPRHHHRR